MTLQFVRNNLQGRTQDFFTRGAYMPKKVPNIQRIINNDILKIVNIVLSGGGAVASPPPAAYGPDNLNDLMIQINHINLSF